MLSAAKKINISSPNLLFMPKPENDGSPKCLHRTKRAKLGQIQETTELSETRQNTCKLQEVFYKPKKLAVMFSCSIFLSSTERKARNSIFCFSGNISCDLMQKFPVGFIDSLIAHPVHFHIAVHDLSDLETHKKHERDN